MNNIDISRANVQEIIISVIYSLITIYFIKLLVYDRKNKYILIPIYVVATLVIPAIWKMRNMFFDEVEIGIHFEYIIVLMRHITNQFYSNIYAVLFSGIILAGMYTCFYKLNKNDKLCVVVGIITILVNIFVIISGYITTINGQSILQEEFNKYYSKLLIFEALIALMMLKPIFLKEKVEENKQI